MALDPRQTYVHLAADGVAAELPGGDAFWSQPQAEIEKVGHGWLVSEFAFDADWPNWEMHPDADEFVYLLAGSADLLLERPDGTQTIALRERAAVVVPRGVWHTAKVHAPSRMLHVTMGSGTQQRPR
jgi:mannose-6-phosphate isomerase-like protein (cupin superfamily)